MSFTSCCLFANLTSEKKKTLIWIDFETLFKSILNLKKHHFPFEIFSATRDLFSATFDTLCFCWSECKNKLHKGENQKAL